MSSFSLIVMIAGLACIAYLTANKRAYRMRAAGRGVLSLPNHYGSLAALWSFVPAVMLLLVWTMLEPAYLERETLASLPSTVSPSCAARVSTPRP